MQCRRIALVGDYEPDVLAHVAIPKALAIAGEALGAGVVPGWIETSWAARLPVSELLNDFDGVWCVPASPYRDQQVVFDIIRHVRDNGIPYLGTCGGFQHAVIEYARNVLGIGSANSVEDDPNTESPLIDALVCAMRNESFGISIEPGSQLASIYGQLEIKETYNCGFGVNARFEPHFENSGLRISARAANGGANAVELDKHPFFIGTAFQPERSALNNASHPLITAFVRATLESVNR